MGGQRGQGPRSVSVITASMQAYDEHPGSPEGGAPGFVLLYAPGFETLQPAYRFTGGEVLIGRDPPASVLLPLPAVSRQHARLSFDGERWWLEDLGSRNGTLVGGGFVSKCPLRPFDEVRVGDVFFKFVPHSAEGYMPYRLDGAVLGGAPATPPGIVGGYQLAAIAAALERIAKSSISVILLGESGTGKEVFARQVHAWSARTGAFCAVNCAAIPGTLLESELFGYRRGAFSGAERDHVGLVRAADQGTLFLDEVGDMPLEAQAKLLRVLQTKEVLPLGATRPEQVDVRVLCATHRDLGSMVAEGRFRGDLYARLNEYSATLPALRARKEDIYALCEALLRLHKRPDLKLTVPYMTGLLHYDWPYNVRELEALIKRGIALAEGGALGAEHLSAEIHQKMRDYGRKAQGLVAPSDAPTPTGRARSPSWLPPAGALGASVSQTSPGIAPLPPGASGTPDATLESATPSMVRTPEAPPLEGVTSDAHGGFTPAEDELRRLLDVHAGNVAAVGRHYGKERMQVHRWMKRYNIDPNQYRR
jgi:transcriptional regulator with GAF, ATPase, and Fis domain